MGEKWVLDEENRFLRVFFPLIFELIYKGLKVPRYMDSQISILDSIGAALHK